MTREEYLNNEPIEFGSESGYAEIDFEKYKKYINDLFDVIESLEQQNTELQARIKELEEENRSLVLRLDDLFTKLLKSNDKLKKIEKEYQEFGG